MMSRSRCIDGPATCGASASSCRLRRVCASSATTSTRHVRRQPKRCRSARLSKIHAESPGVSTCSRGCWPPKDTPTERHGSGVPRTDCSKAWVARWCPRLVGFAIATLSPPERCSAACRSTMRAPRGERCCPRTRLRSRASRPSCSAECHGAVVSASRADGRHPQHLATTHSRPK